MTSLLVRKTECPDCNEPVEVSYTPEEFEKNFEICFYTPFSDTPPPRVIFESVQRALFENVYCKSCSERIAAESSELDDLNGEYWKNYSISNPNE